MSDLAVGYCILAIAAAGLFLLTAWASRSFSPRGCDIAGVAVVVLLFVYIQTMWYDVRMAELLPYANLVVVGI